ncbi:hypothetical protein ACEPAH_2883 [Sanghuangporus vaninii]
MSLALPAEILLRIIEFVFDETPRRPMSLLMVNSYFHNLCLSLLHTVMRFSSIRQLDRFVRTCHKLAFRPRVIFINLAGGTVNYHLFKLLRELFLRIADLTRKLVLDSEYDQYNHSPRGKLGFRRIQLCLNSLRFDENSDYLFKALDLTDPFEFIWTGPDPAHHFSIAIVPIAASYLFKAMQSWTHLRHLKLTNLSFPLPEDGYPTHLLAKALGVVAHDYVADPIDSVPMSPLLPMPYLQTIYLGQITFLDPVEIAMIASATELVSLASMRIVDAYQGSIWGPRIRIMDVEKASASLFSMLSSGSDAGDMQLSIHKACIDRIRKLVSCEALTERIMGGDRMDSNVK